MIVVAIIAILAAIAVPNFLEAQVRSKVARAKADMRSMATALEAYRIDYSHYPLNGGAYGCLYGLSFVLSGNVPALPLFVLTTPVAYITSVPKDIFPSTTNVNNIYQYQSDIWIDCMTYGTPQQAAITPQLPAPIARWELVTLGPDRKGSYGDWFAWGYEVMHEKKAGAFTAVLTDGALYDPSNGTMSTGDIVRIGP